MEVIWYWTNGDKKIFTRKIDIAEKAMKEGFRVMGINAKPRTFKFEKKKVDE